MTRRAVHFSEGGGHLDPGIDDALPECEVARVLAMLFHSRHVGTSHDENQVALFDVRATIRILRCNAAAIDQRLGFLNKAMVRVVTQQTNGMAFLSIITKTQS